MEKTLWHQWSLVSECFEDLKKYVPFEEFIRQNDEHRSWYGEDRRGNVVAVSK
jgi:hypothetical protein